MAEARPPLNRFRPLAARGGLPRDGRARHLTGMKSQRAIVAFVVVAVAAALAVGGYLLIGASAARDAAPGTVSAHGILAMVLGVIGTVLMAGLLMGLAYFSHRSGHDDKAAGRDE